MISTSLHFKMQLTIQICRSYKNCNLNNFICPKTMLHHKVLNLYFNFQQYNQYSQVSYNHKFNIQFLSYSILHYTNMHLCLDLNINLVHLFYKYIDQNQLLRILKHILYINHYLYTIYNHLQQNYNSYTSHHQDSILPRTQYILFMLNSYLVHTHLSLNMMCTFLQI